MQVTRRQYMVLTAANPDDGVVGLLVAAEAVASTAIEHPEWNMDEVREFEDWVVDDAC